MGTNGLRTSIVLGAVTAGAAVFLAACGLGGGSSSGSTSSTTPPTAFKTIPISTTAPSTTAAPGSASTDANGAGGSYTVKAGDYPLGVAKKLGVTLQALQDANGGTLNLVPGQKLKIPTSSGSSTTTAGSSGSTAATTTTTLAPDQPGTYTVRANDGWSIIAGRLGVDANTLAAFNDMTTKSVLTPGMKLKIPPASSTTSTT
jgi:LysM repeat protein